MIDLSQAVVVVPPDLSNPETKAVTMLVEEVLKRTQIRWPVVEERPADAGQVIQVTGYRGQVTGEEGKKEEELKPEGYSIRVAQNGKAPVVEIAGNDARGVLFG